MVTRVKKSLVARLEHKRNQVSYADDAPKRSGDFRRANVAIPGKGFVQLFYGTTKGGAYGISVPFEKSSPNNFLVG